MMNPEQASGALPDPTVPAAERPPPLEAEVRATDLARDGRENVPDDGTDLEATPGEGENAAGFLKQREP
jgi:hypothetical protein